MFGSKSRVVAASIAVAGAVALVVTGATAANAVTIASGTGTLTVNDSYLVSLAKRGIVVVPTGTQTLAINGPAKTLTVTYAATGGDADVNSFSGEVDFNGGLTFLNALNGKHVSLGLLDFNLLFNSFEGTTNDGTTTTAVLDAEGSRVATISGTTQNFTASELAVDSAGATFLDSALGTTAFTGGDVVGSFATSYSS
jgi:hypothetical protein